MLIVLIIALKFVLFREECLLAREKQNSYRENRERQNEFHQMIRPSVYLHSSTSPSSSVSYFLTTRLSTSPESE